MPPVYEKLGVRFLFPDNWRLDESEAYEGYDCVTIQSPETAFWSITIHPPGSAPQKLVDTALAAMRREYQDLDCQPIRETIAGAESTGYDLNFYCLDLTNTAHLRAFAGESGSYLVICQAEDEEYETVAPILRAITSSLTVR